MDFASYVHQYYGNGYLVYQEKGEAGKVCADYMNKTVPKDEVGRVLEKLGIFWHKMSIITFFGRMHFNKNLSQNFYC